MWGSKVLRWGRKKKDYLHKKMRQVYNKPGREEEETEGQKLKRHST